MRQRAGRKDDLPLLVDASQPYPRAAADDPRIQWITCSYHDAGPRGITPTLSEVTFGHALRLELWASTSLRAFDAAIEAGQQLEDTYVHEAVPYLGFLTIRRAYLFPSAPVQHDLHLARHQLRDGEFHHGGWVLVGGGIPSGRTSGSLTSADLDLMAATASYLLWKPGRIPGIPRFITEIQQVMAYPNLDRTLTREAHILMARALLTIACYGRPWPWNRREAWARRLLEQASDALDSALALKVRPAALTRHDLEQSLAACLVDPAAALEHLSLSAAAPATRQPTSSAPTPLSSTTTEIDTLTALVSRAYEARRGGRTLLQKALTVALSLDVTALPIDDQVAFVETASDALALAIELKPSQRQARKPEDPDPDEWSNLLATAFQPAQGRIPPPAVAIAIAACPDKVFGTSHARVIQKWASVCLAAAFRNAPDDDEELGELAVAALRTILKHVQQTYDPFDFVPILDTLDQCFPPEEGFSRNLRRPFIDWMGSACSVMIIQDIAEDDLLDRCVRYWEENLRYAAAGDGGPRDDTLEHAYLNAAVAHNIRYGAWQEAGRDDREDLDTALNYARAAVRIGGEAAGWRTRAALSHLLYVAAERGDDTLAEASARQRRVLEDAFALDAPADRADALTDAFDMLYPPQDDQDLQLFLAAAQTVATCPTTELYHVLAATRRVMDNGGSPTTMPPAVAECVVTTVQECLNRVGDALTQAVEATLTLAFLQGASSYGAAAAAALDRYDHSLQLLEQGATLRVDLLTGQDSAVILSQPKHLGQYVMVAVRNFRPDLHYSISTSSGTAHLDPHGTIRVLNPNPHHPLDITVNVEGAKGRVSNSAVLVPAQLHALAADLGDPLIYLAATEHTGLALMVPPSGRLERVWLPHLTEGRIAEWLTRIEDSTGDTPDRGRATRPTQTSGDALVRGARGKKAPTRAAVDTVIHDIAEAVRPLQVALNRATSAVHLIPVGITAAVPWLAAMSTLEPGHTPATVNASATLLALDLTRQARTSDPIAITAPEPCHDLGGHSLPFLPHAEEEGNYLHRRHKATHFTRANARKEHFLEAVNSQPAFLHLAVHGQIEPHEHASAQLIWTADPTAGPQVTHLEDISTHPISCGLVFLAACWGGTPDRLLPEESISFPTALLRAGALTVIAPLWPIEDATAKAVAVKFYDNWIDQGLPAAQALQRACSQLRASRRHQNATWAAFQMAGRNLRYSDA